APTEGGSDQEHRAGLEGVWHRGPGSVEGDLGRECGEGGSCRNEDGVADEWRNAWAGERSGQDIGEGRGLGDGAACAQGGHRLLRFWVVYALDCPRSFKAGTVMPERRRDADGTQN